MSNSKEQPLEPDWEGFARAAMLNWPAGGVEPLDLEKLAEQYGLLRKEVFDPDKHGCEAADYYGVEPGDPWYVLNYRRE